MRLNFSKYGLNFDLLPNYPDKLVNPRSQVVSIGVESELAKGLFPSAAITCTNIGPISLAASI